MRRELTDSTALGDRSLDADVAALAAYQPCENHFEDLKFSFEALLDYSPASTACRQNRNSQERLNYFLEYKSIRV